MVARVNDIIRICAQWSHDCADDNNEYWNSQIRSWNHKRQMCINPSKTTTNNRIKRCTITRI